MTYIQVPTGNHLAANESSVQAEETTSCNDLTQGAVAMNDDGGRPESQQPAARANSPFRSPPMTDRSLSPQRRPLSQEPPKQQPHIPPAGNTKRQRKQSYDEIDPDQEIQLEPLPIQVSATDDDMWVKVKFSTDDQTPSPTNTKLQHRPSYTEVDPDQEICVEPLPVQMSATDNDMWVKVKYKQLPHQDSLGRRSSSLSNLTNTMSQMSAFGSDCYSNLAELMINVTAPLGTPESSDQRRHSFTEGDDNNLFIKASAANR